MKQQVEPAGTKSPGLERFAKSGDELAGIAGDGLGGADRLAKGPTNLDQFGRTGRLKGLAAPVR
jgi:hypothetical protein